HRGPTVSLGYWNRPEATAAVLKPNPFVDPTCGGDTVCYSGDLVTMDGDGFLYFVARDDAMIKSAGFRISPTEVEEVLMATERFAQVAVIGLPDTWTGQKVVAVGVPTCATLIGDDRNAADTAVRDLRTFVGARLPTYMVPKAIEFVSELPITGNGKVDYKRLVAERS
ncbi:MAG: AMP-dependent synthetase, partial [Pseudomonadota bacterium]